MSITESQEYKRWVNLRQNRRSQVTVIYNDRINFGSLSHVQKNVKNEKLKALNDELERLNEKIQTASFEEFKDEGKLTSDIVKSDEYSDRIRECLVLLKEPDTPSTVDTARSLLKSPVAPLPKFCSEEGEDLVKFLRCFEETTTRFKYPDYDKFLLLKQQVTGRALTLINSLESDKQSYAHAKDLLTLAFASPSTQKFNTIKQISEMKLNYDGDPYDYISKMRNLTEAVKTLKIDSDAFLQYFFWNGLNDTFKTQFVQITNESKPSLKKINENFFDATERYLNATKRFKAKAKENSGAYKPTSSSQAKGKETSSFAANVDFKAQKFRECGLCSQDSDKESSHPIHLCNNYSSPQAKIEKLKTLNGCLKCGGLTHVTNQCRFRFNRRCFCKQWHFSFLCCEPKIETKAAERKVDSCKQESKEIKKENSKEKTKAKEIRTANNVAVITEAMPSILESESILPTFTLLVQDVQLRALKDSGCQSNFIKESVANSQNLKVLNDKVRLNVKGFNSDQGYVTKIVEVELLIGKESYAVNAICIPEIKINVDIPGLAEVSREFIQKGYTLADKTLVNGGNSISDLDFLLGAKSAYCLRHQEIPFGPNKDAIFADTELGIMILGDVRKLLSNLPYLPKLDRRSTEAHSAILQSSTVTDLIPYLIANKSREEELTENAEEKFDEHFRTNVETRVHSAILDVNGKVNEAELKKATDQVLENESKFFTHYDMTEVDDTSTEINQKLTDYALTATHRNTEGRLIMPLLWNSKVAHLLGKNKELAMAILNSNLKKLKGKPDQLKLMDESFKEQERLGIIERIDNLEQFLREHPEHSFLPHMGVFKLDRETTKCRVVYLSNLSQKDSSKPMTISHNQAMFSGPNLNQKISVAMLQLRFDEKLLVYDLQKAFNQICLRDEDANRLLCLWFCNVEKGNFSLVGYRNVRLSFGLRCSPTLLLLGLFKILVVDAQNDPKHLKDLKSLLYQCLYMDNGAVTVNSKEELEEAYKNLSSIYSPYKFSLQQMVTNDASLQAKINLDHEIDGPTPEVVKLLGASWDRINDTLSTKPICLDVTANTKRQILSTIASQYDIYNFNGPIMNRSRIFMHSLQCNKDLGWDDKLPQTLQKEWTNVARQANASPPIKITRTVGRREDTYKLVACTDASKSMYGVVIYMQNQRTGETSFVCAKNRIVNTKLESQTIPSLELQAIVLGTQSLIDIWTDLCGPSCLIPIDIAELVLYSDSLVALSWINACNNKLEKMQKRSVFIQNRITQISKLCEVHSVNYAFINGCSNPADFITRCVSYKQLCHTNYLKGPDLSNRSELSADFMSFMVPNMHFIPGDSVPAEVELQAGTTLVGEEMEHLIQKNRYSNFHRLILIHAKVLEFIHKLKCKVRSKNPDRFQDLEKDQNFFNLATMHVIRTEQRICFPEIFAYFDLKNPLLKDIPNLVRQLNVYKDITGLLRVRSKFKRFSKEFKSSYFPILLPKDSWLTDLIIMNLHEKFAHAGCYTLLNELRKKFYIPTYFSNVKRVLKSCISCRKMNERTVKLNQSSYREVRLHPCEVPFGYCYLDYMGPFQTRQGNQKVKVWLLVITCMWSRAVNLKVCTDMSTREFLRAFQLHSFEYGLPQFCVTDLGSQLVAGANVITTFLSDPDTQLYFQENNIRSLQFEHFYKGCSQLGSLVEVCVKMTKRLIHGAIGNNILSFRDFEFIVAQTVHIVNRRPIAFKDGLRDKEPDSMPVPITPEKLIKGFDLVSINIIPDLQDEPEADPTWISDNPQASVNRCYEKLKKVRKNLVNLYESEFLGTLIRQATNEKDRYRPCNHKNLEKGDIVLIKEGNTKPQHYPMGIVKDILKNESGEVTGATILKGRTRETTKRHVTTLIPILRTTDNPKEDGIRNDSEDSLESIPNPVESKRIKRVAAQGVSDLVQRLSKDNLI